jgi:Zn finger protein HypA/HybF involved in hydrogenase expression
LNTFDLLIVTHALVPWAVVARRLNRHRKLEPHPDAVAKGGRKAKPVKTEHRALRCERCGAPVPLAPDAFKCPYCAAQVTPSAEMALAYRRLEWAKRELERAEATWKRAVVYNAPIWMALFGGLYFCWSAGVLYLAIASGGQSFAALMSSFASWPRLQGLLIFMALPSATCGWFIGGGMATNAYQLPKVLGKVPRASFKALPLAHVECSNCGAALDFPEGRLGSICAYCGSEEIRPSLAGRASREARSLAGQARRSIIDAYRAMVSRRETLLSLFDIMAGLQVLFAIGEVIGRIPYLGPFLEAFS